MPDSRTSHSPLSSTEPKVTEAVTERQQASPESRLTPAADKVINVLPSQLPFSCPLPGQALWNMHPRVFIDIATTGAASCPYCGAQYRLVSEDNATTNNA